MYAFMGTYTDSSHHAADRFAVAPVPTPPACAAAPGCCLPPLQQLQTRSADEVRQRASVLCDVL